MAGKGTFRGGVHPYDGKDLSKDKPVIRLLPKGDLVFPMVQHIGAPAKPLVAVGDSVLVGQKIAEAGGFISACIISSRGRSLSRLRRFCSAGLSVTCSVPSLLTSHLECYGVCTISRHLFA